jgi:quercetin dioxygenase-like cupin family protein/ribonuclease HI
MEIREVSSLAMNAQDVGDGATVTPLYPSATWGQGLVAVDLWEIAPGGTMSRHAHPEEHVLYVLSGQGRLMGEGQDSVLAAVRENTVIHLGPQEGHQLRNTGSSPLRVLVSTPLLVRSDRAYGVVAPRQGVSESGGVSAAEAATTEVAPQPRERASRAESLPAKNMGADVAPSQPATQPEKEAAQSSSSDGEQGLPSVAGLMRRASELKDQPKPERRRPAQPPVEETATPVEEDAPPEEEAEEQSNLMELLVAFDGGTRGATAQGFGRYLVQAPGRKAIVKSVEFDVNYSPAQAQYESLVEGLRYIAARLEATGRTPQQVQLDIRSDNEAVVNGLLGTMKVKEPALRKRQEQALTLLSNFADWRIEWHSPDESAQLFG